MTTASRRPSTKPITPLGYAQLAVDLIEQQALARDRVDWPRVREVVERQCAEAAEISETYATIRWVLEQLADGHSFFSPPSRGSGAIASGTYQDEVQFPTGRVMEGRVATLMVPSFRGTDDQVNEYSDRLRNLIRTCAGSSICGWTSTSPRIPGATCFRC